MLLDDPLRSNDEIWDFFQQRLHGNPSETWATYSTTGSKSLKSLEQVGSAFNLFLLRMTKAWDSESDKDRAPSKIAKALQDLSILRPIWYIGAIWELLFRAEKAITRKDQETAALLREEVLRLWAGLFKKWANPNLHVKFYTGSKIDWSGLPDPSRLSFQPMAGEFNTKQLDVRIYGLLRQMPYWIRDSLAAATLVTSDLLSRQLPALQASEVFDTEYRPFFEFLTKVLTGSRIDNAIRFLQTELEQGKQDSLQLHAMLDRIRGAPMRAALAASSDSVEAFANGRVGMNAEKQQELDLAICKKIGHRLERQENSQIIQIWDELRNDADTAKIPMGNIVYDNLIYAFDKLSRPDLSNNVWNHMISSGVKPNADQWRKLLQGRGRDPETMEKVWRHMLAAGIKPDLQAWNSRIQSLLLWGANAEQGLVALDEMTKAWLAAVDKMWPRVKGLPSTKPALSLIGDFPNAPRPNNHTLNACISGLVNRRFGKQKRVDLIPIVFKWAAGLEISPDVITYNTLIDMCMGDGNMNEVMQLMVQMGKQNIQPDSVTFTMLLNHIFKTSKNAMPVSLEDQEESVGSLLGLMDSAGLRKDKFVYTTLINGLLKAHKNVLGANLVLEAMIKQGFNATPHDWTAFITYYFQEAEDNRGSPNFAAIEAIWNRIQSTDGVIDRILYDRLIEGYARFGEVDLALHFLRRMAKEALKPGWPCLTAVMNALLDRGSMDLAAEIVYDVEHSEGYLPHGVGLDHAKFNPDRNLFWQAVVEAGLREMPSVPLQEKRDVDEGI